MNIRAGGWVSKFFLAVCPARKRWRGEVTSRQKRLGAPEGWNLAEASGAPQAAAPFAKASEAKPPCGSGVRPPPISVPRGGSAARSACPNPENPPQNGSFSCVADPVAPFVPILPQDVAAYVPPQKIFRALGSKTDPVLHIQFVGPWAFVAQNRRIKNWRSYLDRVQTAVLGEK